MSETKTNEPVKQEGEFSLKGKSKKPKQLGDKNQEITKVNLKEPLVDLPADVTKVVIPKEELKKQDEKLNQILGRLKIGYFGTDPLEDHHKIIQQEK